MAVNPELSPVGSTCSEGAGRSKLFVFIMQLKQSFSGSSYLARLVFFNVDRGSELGVGIAMPFGCLHFLFLRSVLLGGNNRWPPAACGPSVF